MISKGGRPDSGKTFLFRRLPAVAAAILCISGCKPRAFNGASAASASKTQRPSKSAEAQAEALMPYWPAPKNKAEAAAHPAVTALGIPAAFWKKLLNEAFAENSLSGQSDRLTLSNPECALDPDAWRVTFARLSLYETDLPGNITAWQTLALQRESDLAQRVQLHVTVQPWCGSERLGRSDFLHTLDHAFLFTFDLTLPQLKKHHRDWLTSITSGSRTVTGMLLRAENQILPYARALAEVHDGSLGRTSIVRAWNSALQTENLIQQKIHPSSTWLQLKESLSSSGGFGNTAQKLHAPVHPLLTSAPAALNSFFARFAGEEALIRVRAHITEGLGTSQRFLVWENLSGQFSRAPQQTISAVWNRGANVVTLNPLMREAGLFSRVGEVQPAVESLKHLLKDVDSESTLLAEDVSSRELIALAEKATDGERTSVQTTRCVSCHGFDEALRLARSGSSAVQRGLSPAQLTLAGVTADARPAVNIRTLRSALADAIRFEEEATHGKSSAQR